MHKAIAPAAFVVLSILSLLARPVSAEEQCLSLFEAAHAALDEAMGLSEEFEHGGLLYEVGDCHFYTAPQNSGSEHNLEIRVRIPRGAQVSGIYHTHRTHNMDSYWFSKEDVRLHRDLGSIPSFLGDMRTGKRYQLVYEKWHYIFARTGIKGTPFERDPLVASAK